MIRIALRLSAAFLPINHLTAGDLGAGATPELSIHAIPLPIDLSEATPIVIGVVKDMLPLFDVLGKVIWQQEGGIRSSSSLW